MLFYTHGDNKSPSERVDIAKVRLDRARAELTAAERQYTNAKFAASASKNYYIPSQQQSAVDPPHGDEQGEGR